MVGSIYTFSYAKWGKNAGKQHIQKTIVIKIYNQLHKTTTTNAIDN